jgi:hypothetical protein
MILSVMSTLIFDVNFRKKIEFGQIEENTIGHNHL